MNMDCVWKRELFQLLHTYACNIQLNVVGLNKEGLDQDWYIQIRQGGGVV